ncbi:hypothetical protein Ptr902_09233 [Pyrenophora tritici-repentis]|uniref:N-acetyltransferase domain-containing protein n=1 Tax=Pyrenophora tritici-repentis (strain Pt-1C-BFP) TaxID=426418 RepID=B2W1S2_PYRTR|nr:uncharacterized protein PTRG_04407 [Pyrenophora tritici-repentis Pt-1C-BFP]KAA8619497.1 hypothetical protein PtrV1_06591 [Pyrenophora tritici-repentis]EDU47245.1 conserved hypothetical protein [Pyrenophora tritici-repentis Pt-1C-BFP]KAF7447641.1 hypothetical protein A1F99_070050 [Pyrenophora tritici-repentis]KAI0589581.1 hypothetical protein Alg130_02890 [Pyrenophora tritici-repentis]KAI1536920.1 hypothetical protein PtrSN001C_006316 [Pyrenophora tritici-repentis]
MSKIPIPKGLIEEPIEHAVDIIGKTFASDPFQRFCCMEEMKEAGTLDVPLEINTAIFREIICGLVENGGRCITVANSGISSVWTLDAVHDEYQANPAHPPMVHNMNTIAHSIRRANMPPSATHCLHLAVIGNDRSHPSNDSSRNAKASDVMRPVMAIAREKGWPVMLEATSPKGRDMYLHLGFQNLSEIHVGQGQCDVEGRAKEGGEGMPLWVMMYT